MVRFTFRKKKSKDDIKHKTPVNEIKHKTPGDVISHKIPNHDLNDEILDDPRRLLVLPPPRERRSPNIDKSNVVTPTSRGIHHREKYKQESKTPPITHNMNNFAEPNKIPVKSPLKQKKNAINQPLQKIKVKTPSRTHPPPSTKGTKKTGKKGGSNKPLHKQIVGKAPSKTKIPPPSIGLKDGRKQKIPSHPLPERIKTKKPSRIREDPPIFEEEIPKTRIRGKKPK
ncbi:MAG: hypothetical protein ACXAEU_10165 [Candidatus Hodarchaeales archaeon]|jgi:hypothetical protein